MAPSYLKGDGPAIMRARLGPCITGPCGGIGVVIQCHTAGVMPGGPAGRLDYVYDTVTHTGTWGCDIHLEGWITDGGPTSGLPNFGDYRANHRFQTCVTQYYSTPSVGQTWDERWGTANGTKDELSWKWTYQYDYKRSLGPVEIIAEAAHFGGIWYHWRRNEDGTQTTLVDTGVPLHGYADPFVQTGDMIDAINAGGSGAAWFEVTTPSPPSHASENNSVYDITATFPVGHLFEGTYHSRLEINRSNICSIAPSDPLNGTGPYEVCKGILDQIDLADLSKEYDFLVSGTPGPYKLEFHNIYLISPRWPQDEFGAPADGRPFVWAIAPIFGFWDETHGVEIGGPNDALISPESWENFKVQIGQTNGGGLLCAQNQWVQSIATNLGGTDIGLILSKARAVENVQAGHVFYPEMRPRETSGWTVDDGYPLVGYGYDFNQFPTPPVPCHSVGAGDLRFGIPGEGIGIIYRRCQHAFYTTYDPVTDTYTEHERPPCWNWPPCIGCEEDI